MLLHFLIWDPLCKFSCFIFLCFSVRVSAYVICVSNLFNEYVVLLKTQTMDVKLTGWYCLIPRCEYLGIRFSFY